jgi:hypothetical protein
MAVICDRHLRGSPGFDDKCWDLARHFLADTPKAKAWPMDAELLAMRFLAVAEAYLREIEERYPVSRNL